MTEWVSDGNGLFSSWKWEGDTLVRRQIQPARDSILEFNQELRKNEGALQHLSFAGAELNIPDLDLIRLQKKYPELNSPHGETRTRAWLKFMGSAEADPYRLRDRKRPRAIKTP